MSDMSSISGKPLESFGASSKPLTDAQKAAEYRARLTPIMEQAIAIMSEAKAEGLIVSFSINGDQYGRSVLSPIGVIRAF